jgi:hypothetical protein
MNDMDFETRLHDVARGMEYPRTPNIAGSVMPRLRHFDTVSKRRTVSAAPVTKPRLVSRPWAWSLVIVLILLSSLLLIPPARAAIIEFIQIGIVRIFPRSAGMPLTPTGDSPAPDLESSKLLLELDRLAGETTLANAKQRVSYPISLPAFPVDLGEPDHVFVQDADGSITILVWLDPQDSTRILLSLHLIPEGSWVIHKSEPVTVQETLVNGQRAAWAVGPYPLMLSNGNLEFTRLIDGHVLIWAEGEITYRLESGVSLEEAVKIAESLQPMP